MLKSSITSHKNKCSLGEDYMKMSARSIEGDVNTTELRKSWQETSLSEDTKEKLHDDSRYFLSQALSTPCLTTVKSVEGVYIIDDKGNRIFDFHGNSTHQLGYNHPKLKKALLHQLEELSFSPRRFANETATKCAKKLCELMPSDDYKVLFTTSGAVSNETALKLVRKVTGKHKILAAADSFHGATFMTIAAGGTPHFKKDLEPMPDYCFHFPHFSSYQGEDNDGEEAIKIIERICSEHEIGAILVEPVRCTDVQIPPKSYWRKIREICDKHDIALIFDEIPTAFGRTGKMYCFENFGVEPDILTIGKGMGGSLIPFSAVIAKNKFDDCGDTSMGHFTHEKNPLGSAVALALIETIEEEGLLERADQIGDYMKKRILSIYTSLIGDVRQIGALVGVELVLDKITKEKAVIEAEQILYNCLSNGLSFKISSNNVLTLAPPIIITDDELEKSMDILEKAFLEI